MADVGSDCRTAEGVAVGLIDGIIAIARVLRQADRGTEAVREALADLRTDEDVLALLSTHASGGSVADGQNMQGADE